MKAYPSILPTIIKTPVYAFDKLDGSNVRAEWSKKTGFYKFGSKSQLISDEQRFLTKAPGIIKAKYEKDLSEIFVKQRYERAIVFFEFYGLNSFAGHHLDEDHTVTLIDVNPHKKGILYPKEYLGLFGHLDIAKLLYRGNPNSEFEELVRTGKLSGMTFEGVVCKAPNGRTPMPIMFKIKNQLWINKLKEYCKGDELLFKKLL